MNSNEAFRGFVSFLILSGALGLSYASFKYISSSTNLLSVASNTAELPKYVEVTNPSADSVSINWYTNTSIVGVVIYSSNKNCFEDKKNNYQTCELVSEENSTKNHSLWLGNLTPATTYYYKIKGDNYIYPDKDILSFSTSNSVSNTNTTEETSITNESEPIESNNVDNLEEPAALTPSTAENDFDGFSETSDDKVLGITTSAKYQSAKKISAEIIEEFKNALIFNDLRYDFDKNGKVENADYALFIQFIKNSED